jgi:hypothetical protein
MALAKVKMAAAILAALLLVGSGAGALAWQRTTAGPSVAPPTIAPVVVPDVVPPVAATNVDPIAIDKRTQDLQALSAKVPRAVLDAVLARFPAAELVEAAREIEAGRTVYDVTIKDRGQNIAVTLTLDAVIVGIEKEITARDLPPAVAQTLAARYPKMRFRKVEEVYKVAPSTETLDFYELLLVTPDRKKTFSVCVAPNGAVVREEK